MDTFIAELDKALISQYDYIIIEPSKLGDETSRWINVGNCLHQTAVLTGLASIASSKLTPFRMFNLSWNSSSSWFHIAGFIWPRSINISTSVGFISLFCTSLYTISWSTDPCCQYQIEKNPNKFPKFPLNDFTSPVVLAYKSNKKKKYLHCAVTSVAVGLCAYKIYDMLKWRACCWDCEGRRCRWGEMKINKLLKVLKWNGENVRVKSSDGKAMNLICCVVHVMRVN